MNKVIITISLFLTSVITLMADVTFRATAPQAVAVGQQFRVEYVLSTQGSGIQAQLDGDDFKLLYGPSTGSSSSVSIVNGQMSQEVRTTFSYVLMGQKEGTFTIPAATCKGSDGKTYTSNTLTIKVLPADEPTSKPQPSAGQSGQATVGKDDCHLELDLSKTTAYEGEAIVATLKLYWRNHQMGNPSDVKLPDFEGFTVQEIDNSNAQATLEHYRGANYQMYPLAKWLLFPTRTGEVTIPASSLKANIQVITTRRSGGFFDWPMEYTQNVSVPLTSAARRLNIKPLPSGKPDSYMNAVGEFRCSSQLTSQQVKTNDAVIYRLVIEGTGNLKYVTEPQVDFPSDFEVYDPKVELDTRTTSSGVSGKKVIEYTLIPRHAGTFQIPALSFTYFDAKSGQYRTVQTSSHTLEVQKGAGDGASGTTGSMVDFSGNNQERLRVLGNDIRYLHPVDTDDLTHSPSPFYGTWLFWLWFLLPALLFVALLVVYHRQLRLNADLAGVRTRKAGKVAERRLKDAAAALRSQDKSAFYEAVHKAMLGYASDKLRIPLSELSIDTVSQQLIASQVSESLVADVRNVLETCEFARYAPSQDAQAMDDLYQRASHTLDRLESEVKISKKTPKMRLLLLLFSLAVGSAMPLTAQQADLQSAALAYDSAQYQLSIDAYEQVLSQYGGNAALYYNLAGAYYKQKQYARAVLNYERSLLLDPSNADTQANLELARLQCVDKIESIQPVIFVTWSNALRDSLSCHAWSVLSIVFFLAFLALLSCYFFGRVLWLRKTGFYGAVVAVLLSATAMHYAHAQAERLLVRDYAIVMAPSVVVRSSPAESGTQLFTIHEGLKVRVRSTLSGWSEIELSDGNVGWMPSEGLENI